MSMLWGIVFFTISSGFLVAGGRPALRHQGNYDLMWWVSIGLGVFAAVIHWLIRERPVPRLVMAAAPS